MSREDIVIVGQSKLRTASGMIARMGEMLSLGNFKRHYHLIGVSHSSVLDI